MYSTTAYRFVFARLTADATLMSALGTPSAPYAVHEPRAPEGAVPPWVVLFQESGQSTDATGATGGWDTTLYSASFQVKVQVAEEDVDLLDTLATRVLA